MDTISKVCSKCKVDKPLSEYYFRNGKPHSYCKACIAVTTMEHRPLSQQVPKDATEIVAIEYLKSKGIPSLPGKALKYSHVDIVAFGCVRIEVKSSILHTDNGVFYFKWTISPTQIERGVLADLIMLVCDYGTRKTFHVFSKTFPAFYINGKRKTGFNFTPGATEARKFGTTRVVMTQPMMDEAEDDVRLIYTNLRHQVKILKSA